MGFKIFLLIATFCLVEVKSHYSSLQVRVQMKDILKIHKKMNGFAEAVTLHGAKCLWEVKNSRQQFQNCYANKKSAHEKAIATFTSQTILAGSTLNTNLPPYYRERVKNARSYITNLTNFVKNCQNGFSEKISKNEIVGINQFLNNCKANIEEELIKLHAELQGIHDTTSLGSDLKALAACEKELEKQINEFIIESKFIIQDIRSCM